MSPNQGIVVELMRFYDDPDRVSSFFKQQQRELDVILAFCEETIVAEEAARGIKVPQSAQGVQAFLSRTKDRVVTLLSQFGDRVTHAGEDGLLPMEDYRATLVSTAHQAELAAGECIIGSVSDSLQAASTRFLNAVMQIRSRLANVLQYDHSMIIEDCIPPYIHADVFESKPIFTKAISVLSLELYPQGPDAPGSLWLAQFATYSYLQEFLDLLENDIFANTRWGLLNIADDTFVPVNLKDTVFDQAILIHTGSEWLALNVVSYTVDTDSGETNSLKRVIGNALAKTRVKRTLRGTDIHVPPEVGHVRFATRRADFCFDCEPQEGESNRYISVLSKDPLPVEWQLLVESFSPRMIASETFSSVLGSVVTEMSDTHIRLGEQRPMDTECWFVEGNAILSFNSESSDGQRVDEPL